MLTTLTILTYKAMEGQEKPQPQNAQLEWQERKEREYREAVEAADSLYQMSLSGEEDETKIKQLCETIGPYGPFQDHLAESEMGTWENGQYTGAKRTIAPQFFETLPILNRMAQIYNNFSERSRAKGSLFLNSEVHEVSRGARFALHHGLLAVNEETLSQLDEKKTKDFFESLKLILTHDIDYGIEETINFLNRHRELFAQLSETKQLPNIQNQFDELQNFLKTREFERVLIGAVQSGINARRERNRYKVKIEHCEGLLREILTKYGFDPDEILDVWSGSHTEHGPQPQIGSNMDAVFDLEDKREGIARLLYKEFGIRNFERYPQSILIAQFDEFEDLEKPYGVMIQATHDWNGAFASWSDRQVWEKLFEQIKEQYAFRIAEAKSKAEVARRLIGFNRKYGEHHKIAFAFIGGHGSKDSITLGGPHRRNKLLSEDLTGRGVKRTGGFFEPHPTIALVSCSTGAEGGIGQELSKVLGAKIIAPSVPTGLKNIEAILTSEGIDFKVEYSSKDESQDIGKVYSGGEKVLKINS